MKKLAEKLKSINYGKWQEWFISGGFFRRAEQNHHGYKGDSVTGMQRQTVRFFQ